MAKYRIIAESWDQILSKPGEPLNYTRHRKGAVVDVPDAEVDRLLKAGAIEAPAKARTAAKAAPRSAGGRTPARKTAKAADPEPASTGQDPDEDGDDLDGEDADSVGTGEVERPKRTAPVEDWVAYAVSKGLAEDYASALDRDALIAELS